MLMMCPVEFSFRWPIIDASEVDLPVPVAPTKMIMPRFAIARSSTIAGVAIIEDGGGLLLQVERNGQKVLIPFVQSFIREIDLEGGKIDLELPPGLLETCASTS